MDEEVCQPAPHLIPHFVVRYGLLSSTARGGGREKELFVVSKGKKPLIFEPTPWPVIWEQLKTIQHIRNGFYWLGIEEDIKGYCQSCPTCQRTSSQRPPPSPLISLPIIEVPIERIEMDLVVPLPNSARGHVHILVVLDYATYYPKAIPLRKATAKAISKELFMLFSHVCIPSEILTDQGTPFLSRLMTDICHLLKMKQLRTSVNQPQTDGLV